MEGNNIKGVGVWYLVPLQRIPFKRWVVKFQNHLPRSYSFIFYFILIYIFFIKLLGTQHSDFVPLPHYYTTDDCREESSKRPRGEALVAHSQG